MNKSRYEVLARDSKGKKITDKRRGELILQLNKLLDKKAVGVFLLSEVDKKGDDLIHYFAFNCDKKHSRLLINLLVEHLPGIKDELNEFSKELTQNEKVAQSMVR